MMKGLSHVLFTALAVAIGIAVLPTIIADSISVVLLVVVLGIFNAATGRILTAISLPANSLSIGLFIFIVNIGIIFVADKLFMEFEIGYWAFGVWLGIILWFFNWGIEAVAEARDRE